MGTQLPIYKEKKQQLHIFPTSLPMIPGLSTEELLCIYKSLICPFCEYACQVWSTSLTKEQGMVPLRDTTEKGFEDYPSRQVI